VDDIDKAKFAGAMAPVMSAFEQKFGRETIDTIRHMKVADQ
jgi:hypothetical protein